MLYVRSISNSPYHSLFLTKDGKVFSCGWNGHGQLGLGKWDVSVFVPEEISYFTENGIKIRSVDASRQSFSLFLSTEGKVYGCGFNSFGQLGVGNKTNQHCPKLVNFKFRDKTKLIGISGGLWHSLFLTSKLEVYYVGSNKYGECGKDPELHGKNTCFPRKIKFFEEKGIKIIQASAGSDCSFFISSTNRVYFCGRNQSNVANLDKHQSKAILKPILVPIVRNIMQVSAGEHYVVMLSKTGKVYSFGNKISVGREKVDMSEDGLVDSIKEKIIQVEAGILCSNVLLLTENYEVYSYGNDSVGKEKNEKITFPKKIFPQQKFVQISAGKSSLFLNKKGECFGIGNNEYGQLIGKKKTGSLKTPQNRNVTKLKNLTALPKLQVNTFVTMFQREKIQCKKEQLLSLIKNSKEEIGIRGKKKIKFVFESKMEIKVLCSKIFRSSVLKERIKKEKSREIKIEDNKLFIPIQIVVDWLNGCVKKFKNITDLKDAVFVSLEWNIRRCAYELLEKVETFDTEEIIKMVINLKIIKKNESSMYVKCMEILKRRKEDIVVDDMKRIMKEMSIGDEMSDELNVLKEIKSLEITSVDNHEDFKDMDFFFQDKELQKHYYDSFFDEFSKNIIFETIDNKFVACHRVIISRIEYFNLLLTSPFLEKSLEEENKVIKLNFDSVTFVFILSYLYFENLIDVDPNLENLKILYVLERYCEKFQIPKLREETVEKIGNIFESAAFSLVLDKEYEILRKDFQVLKEEYKNFNLDFKEDVPSGALPKVSQTKKILNDVTDLRILLMDKQYEKSIV